MLASIDDFLSFKAMMLSYKKVGAGPVPPLFHVCTIPSPKPLSSPSHPNHLCLHSL